MTAALRTHWPEYLIEAVGLGIFMLSACAFGVLIFHPASTVHVALREDFARRAAMGLAMATTSLAIIYSPWGQRSGAHINPSTTLAFLRLGKLRRADAMLYIAAQFVGGVAGVALSWALLRGRLAHASVRFVATVPGRDGSGVAFAAEVAISFVLMSAVLVVSSSRFRRFTGVCASALVALYITFESPLSGMSMNPARSFGSALFAGALAPLWIYFLAPLAGMQLAVALMPGAGRRGCAKLDHPAGKRCIFCGQQDAPRATDAQLRLGALKA